MAEIQESKRFYMYCEVCGVSSTHVHVNQWTGICQDCAKEIYEQEKGSY